MTVITIPRTFGGTLFLNLTVATSPVPGLSVTALFRDGDVLATARDGATGAHFRDGLLHTLSRDGDITTHSRDGILQMGGR